MANISENIVDGCPAFGGGCPFAADHASKLPVLIGNIPRDTTRKCPAFSCGCPFKSCQSVEALYNCLAEMPCSHRIDNDADSARAVGRMLQMVHEQSKGLKSQMGAQCPVFATSCPFRTMTSQGKPLMSQLDDIISRWGLSEDVCSKEALGGLRLDSGTLSQSLKAGTKVVHRAAENVRFVRDFLCGNVPKESYVVLLRGLYHIYNVLETALDALPPHLKHCDFGKLKRCDALAADLRFFTGESSPASVHHSSIARQYGERLQSLALQKPELLLAHAYTRYMGDLSGGQILARAAVKAYDLPTTGEGIAFYNFELIGQSPLSVKQFKREYRSSLDALRLSATDADALISEANVAFLMNMLLFEERDVAAGHLSRVRSLDEVSVLVQSNKSALGFQRAYAMTKTRETSSKCPFLLDAVVTTEPARKCPFMPPAAMGGASGGTCPFDPTSGAKAGERCSKCPVMPAAATQGNPAKTGSTALAVCPWPFLWLHDRHAARSLHPKKNVSGLIFLMGFAGLAWRDRRGVGMGLLGAILLLSGTLQG